MSSRRLPVIIFVSLIGVYDYVHACVARSAFGGRRGFLHHKRAMTRLPLRLLHSLLSSSCLLDVSPQPWVVRSQLFHASSFGCLFNIIYLFFQSVSYHIILVILQWLLMEFVRRTFVSVAESFHCFLHLATLPLTVAMATLSAWFDYSRHRVFRYTESSFPDFEYLLS